MSTMSKLCHYDDEDHVDVMKAPDLFVITGSLSKTNEERVFKNIQHKLIKLNNGSSQLMIDCLQCCVSPGHSHDLNVLSFIHGCWAFYNITRDIDQTHCMLKSIYKTLDTYKLLDRDIIESHINYRLFQCYTLRGKLGKAYNVMQKAVYQVNGYAPSTWTAHVYHRLAQMNELLSFTFPKLKVTYLKKTIETYRLAVQHMISQDIQTEWNVLVCMLLYTIDIKLQLPTLHILNSLSVSITTRHFNEHCPGNDVIIEAEEDFKSIKTIAGKVERNPFEVHERIMISEMNVSIRKAQVYIKDKTFDLALRELTKCNSILTDWTSVYSLCGTSWCSRHPSIQTTLSDMIIALSNQVMTSLTLHHCINTVTLTHHDSLVSGITTASGISDLEQPVIDTNMSDIE